MTSKFGFVSPRTQTLVLVFVGRLVQRHTPDVHNGECVPACV